MARARTLFTDPYRLFFKGQTYYCACVNGVTRQLPATAENYRTLEREVREGRKARAKARADAAKRRGFCLACGATIPPRDGEGVCQVCQPGIGEPPIYRAPT